MGTVVVPVTQVSMATGGPMAEHRVVFGIRELGQQAQQVVRV